MKTCKKCNKELFGTETICNNCESLLINPIIKEKPTKKEFIDGFSEDDGEDISNKEINESTTIATIIQLLLALSFIAIIVFDIIYLSRIINLYNTLSIDIFEQIHGRRIEVILNSIARICFFVCIYTASTIALTMWKKYINGKNKLD